MAFASQAIAIGCPLINKPRDTWNSFKSSKRLQTRVEAKVDLEYSGRVDELQEMTKSELRRDMKPVEAMELIDSLEWLGISYHYEEEIDLWLGRLAEWNNYEDDLYSAALRFRLLRQNACPVTADVFKKFKAEKQSKEGLLSLYEASYLATKDEEDTFRFGESELKSRMLLPRQVPRHLRMERLESKLYIDHYRKQKNRSSILLEHAIFDYNQVQNLYQSELIDLKRWWKQLGLIDKLSFARDRLFQSFFWTVGTIPNPKYSDIRIEMAKVTAILTVIDDMFDIYAPLDELHLFTKAIQRWDVNAIEQLPEYMKICYMALYNTTTDIANKVLIRQGMNILPFLIKSWIDTIEAFMIEAKWFNNGNIPSVEDYLKNGVTTSGSYMALTQMFFLMGEGLTPQNVQLMEKPYPKLFSNSGAILRLWDDLGTAKEEQDMGDNASIMTSLVKEKITENDDEAREYIGDLIKSLWKDMNAELLGSSTLPLPLIKGCFNMARTSQVVYQHQENTYFSSVNKFISFLLSEPIKT